MVPLPRRVCHGIGAWGNGRRSGGPGAVAVGSIVALTMLSRIGDVGGDAVNPFERIQRETGGTGARIRWRLRGQAAVLEWLQGIHGQGGARDVTGLDFERG